MSFATILSQVQYMWLIPEQTNKLSKRLTNERPSLFQNRKNYEIKRYYKINSPSHSFKHFYLRHSERKGQNKLERFYLTFSTSLIFTSNTSILPSEALC
jgi:hypothetical protein